jgi:hypothetical protein
LVLPAGFTEIATKSVSTFQQAETSKPFQYSPQLARQGMTAAKSGQPYSGRVLPPGLLSREQKLRSAELRISPGDFRGSQEESAFSSGYLATVAIA